MSHKPAQLTPWFTFAGCTLVIAVLYWAQAVLVPIAVAILVTFVLARPVGWLERRIGRLPAVLLVVALVFSGLGAAGWAIADQLGGLAADLPTYRTNIREKVADVRDAGKGGSVEQVQETLEEIQSEIEQKDAPRGSAARPIVVRPEQVDGLWGFPAWFGSLSGPLATAGLVVALVIFMLLEREELRGRLIGLIGHGHLAATTKAFDEAGARVSRQLLMQTLVNALYGVGAGTGLYLLGVPYPFLWATLGAALRFIPYVGPLMAAGAPIVISLAALPGWERPLMVVGLFIALELFTNLVLETVLFAGAAGVSQVALLVAVAFWAWLWGPMGLLLATPLTVCLVVLGKHVPGLEFLSTLMASSTTLAPDIAYYQRLLARDHSEASDLIERHAAAHGADTIYDALLLPALSYAERDRLESRLSPAEEADVIDATRELMADAAVLRPPTRIAGEAPGASIDPVAWTDGPDRQVRDLTVLAYPANATADELALRMLAQVLGDGPVSLDVLSDRLLTAELVEAVRQRACRVVCIADLPPSPPSKTRYLVRKLHAALPEVTIVVGRWAPPALADESRAVLVEAGARHVGTTLLETRDHLLEIAGETAPVNAVASR